MGCSIGHGGISDLALLWLWLAAAAPIQPLAWKLPYAAVTLADAKGFYHWTFCGTMNQINFLVIKDKQECIDLVEILI